jgi:hypothetical protein
VRLKIAMHMKESGEKEGRTQGHLCPFYLGYTTDLPWSPVVTSTEILDTG